MGTHQSTMGTFHVLTKRLGAKERRRGRVTQGSEFSRILNRNKNFQVKLMLGGAGYVEKKRRKTSTELEE